MNLPSAQQQQQYVSDETFQKKKNLRVSHRPQLFLQILWDCSQESVFTTN
jgi:hypothetical protein